MALGRLFGAVNRRQRRQGSRRSHPSHVSEALEDRLLLFALAARWSNTATDGSGLTQGDAATVTWSIVPDGTPIPALSGLSGESSDPSNLVAFLSGIYGTVTNDNNYTDEVWFPHFQSTFDRWSELSGLTFVYVSYDDGASFSSFAGAAPGVLGLRADVRIGGHRIDGNSGVLGYNFYPNNGEMVIDTADTLYPSTGNAIRLRQLLAHESGHGLGLQHVISSDSKFLMEGALNTSFDGPQFDDILGLQRHYGDAFEKNGGNDTVASATPLGSLGDGQTITIGADAHSTAVLPSMKDFVSIDDESDIDFYSFTVSAAGSVSIQLTPMGPTYLVGPQGGSESSFNAAAQSDLALALYDTNGSTILVSANNTGIGGSESINGHFLPAAGTYYVRVTGSTLNKVQMYRLDLSNESASAPAPELSIADVTVNEGDGTATFIVSLNTPADTDVSFSYATSDNTALAGVDYVAASGNRTISAGQTSTSFTVQIIDDNLHEPTETFFVTISSPVGASISRAVATGTIIDNDALALTLTVSPSTFSEGAGAQAATGTVTRNSTNLSSSLLVNLSSSDTTEATVPASVTIPAGQSSATFFISAVDDNIVDGSQTVTITAAATSYVSGTANVTVTDNDALLRPTVNGPSSPTPHLRPQITWTESPGATHYDVWVANQSTGENPFYLATVTETFHIPTMDLGVGVFNVWVQAGNDHGISQWSPQYQFRINTRVSTRPGNRFREDHLPTIEWDPLPGAVRYDVWINNHSAGISEYIRDQHIAGTSFTPDADLPLGVYRAWVRAVSANGWAGMWSVMEEFLVVSAPVVTQGQNSTFDRTPTFTWQPSAGAVRYEVYIRNRNTGQTVVYDQQVTDTTWTAETAIPDGPYRWWLLAVGANNIRSYWTEPMDIFIGGRSEVLSPSGSSSDANPTFTWRTVDGAVRYELWVDRVGVQTGWIHETHLTGTSYVHSSPLPSGNYRVWVRAVSVTNEFSPWSLMATFSVVAEHSPSRSLEAGDAKQPGRIDRLLAGLFGSELERHLVPRSESEDERLDQLDIGQFRTDSGEDAVALPRQPQTHILPVTLHHSLATGIVLLSRQMATPTGSLQSPGTDDDLALLWQHADLVFTELNL